MKPFIKLLSMAAFSMFVGGSAQAQSWTHGADRATAPRAISGEPSGGFEVVCTQGEWVMYQFTGVSANEGSMAKIIVDGQQYGAPVGFYGAGDEGILLSPQILSAFKAGNTAEVQFLSGTAQVSIIYTLKGSSRALNAVAANCASPTPATAPERFILTPEASSSEAITKASVLLRPILDEAHDIDPNVGIQDAGLTDLNNGWRFLVSNIGLSTALYGIVGYETVIFAKPPTEDWRFVGSQIGAAIYIDSQNMTNGYPNIIQQSVRGVNQPFNLWTWNGSEYAHSQTLQ